MKPDEIQDGAVDTGGLEKVRRQWRTAVEEGARESASIKSSAFHPGDAAAPASSEAISTPRREVVTGNGDGNGTGAGDFMLGKLLGRGGMGLVFRAEQSGLDRAVALKTIIAEHAADAAARRKFFAEARVTGQLEHPNIVPIHELAAAPDGSLFYTMKEVRGRPWSKALSSLSENENIDILLKVADAVAFAHGKGVIHRDLKPENVMLGDYGEVLLMDWGLAAGVGPGAKAERLSAANARGGTPAYMAPEMAAADADKIGTASDVYLLGAILYEILTGLRPHHGQNVFACIFSAMKNTIQDSPRRDELMDVARRALATGPAGRFRDAREFQRAIRDCREHAASLALSDEAQATLKAAKKSGDYTDHARAVFGFGESLRLWPGNGVADLGLTMSRKAYAEAALARGDYELALSQARWLPAEEGTETKRRAAAGKEMLTRRRARIMLLTRLSVGLAGLVFLIGAVAYWRTTRAEKTATEALAAKTTAEAWRDALADKLATLSAKLDAEFNDGPDSTAKAGTVTAGRTARAVEEIAELDADWAEKLRLLAVVASMGNSRDDFRLLMGAFSGLASAARSDGDDAAARRADEFAATLREAVPADMVQSTDGAGIWSPNIHSGSSGLRPLPPKPFPDGETTRYVPLESLNLLLFTPNPWVPPSAISEDEPVNITGRRFVRGVKSHAFSAMDIRVNDAVRFSGWTGVTNENDPASLTLVIYGDGELLWQSEVMRGKTPAVHFDVDLTGVYLMTLVVDMVDFNHSDHIALADAQFAVRGENAPESVLYDPILIPHAYAVIGKQMGFRFADDKMERKIPDAFGHAVLSWVRTLHRFGDLENRRELYEDIFGVDGAPLPSSWTIPPSLPSRKSRNGGEESGSSLSPSADASTIEAELRKRNPDYKGGGQYIFGENGQVAEINLGEKNISDISPLSGLPILKLNLSPNPIDNIEALRGMPLEWLDLGGCRMTDLRPLADSKRLAYLRMRDCRVKSLEPLRGQPLKNLDVYDTDVDDLSPLAGMRLEIFVANGAPVRDLSPLAGMPLRELHLWYTKVNDVSVLRGMPLEVLMLGGCRELADLSPLAGLPLKDLSLRGTRVKDLSVLKDMPLEKLGLDDSTVTDISPLAGMKTLKQLDIKGLRLDSREPLETLALDNLTE